VPCNRLGSAEKVSSASSNAILLVPESPDSPYSLLPFYRQFPNSFISQPDELALETEHHTLATAEADSIVPRLRNNRAMIDHVISDVS